MQKREREKVQKREGEKVQKGRGGGEAEGVTLVSARGGDRPCEASGAIKKSSLPPLGARLIDQAKRCKSPPIFKFFLIFACP